MSVTVSFFPNSFRAQFCPFLTTCSKLSQDLETINPPSLKEDKQLGTKGEILLIKKLWKNLSSLLSQPKLSTAHTCISRKWDPTRSATLVQTLTLADEGRGCFPRMDTGSDEHHFLFSPWTQVCCSRKGQGTEGKKEKWRSLNCAPDVDANNC